ncbi:hypothetical protein V8F20_002627 [Naviculisporaceae sp. PSN 640]
MRRPLGFRKAPPASAGWSMIEHMAHDNFNSPRSPTRTRSAPSRTTATMSPSQNSSSSASSSRLSLSKRDTGFPEGFCGNRNTSLPHPNANLSPDACITEDDINITRALARHRMSFIAQKEKQHRINRGMALNSIEETDHQQSSSSRGGVHLLAGGRDPTFSTVGRLALSSLHGAEFRRHLRRPGSNGTNSSDDSGVSNGTVGTTTSTIVSSNAGREGSVFSEEEAASSVASSSPPASPTPSPYRDGGMTKGLLDKDKDASVGANKDPREEKRDPRDGRVPMGGSIDGGANGGDSQKKAKKRSSRSWFHRLIHR